MQSRYTPSNFHSLQISRSAQLAGAAMPQDLNEDNQDCLLAEMVASQARSLRAQRSQYLPEPLPFPPVVVVR